MSIQAQSADGAVHEFPDDTPDDVIDRVMKAYAAGGDQEPHSGAQPIGNTVSQDPQTGEYILDINQGSQSPPPAPQKSQLLGFQAGFNHPLDNVAKALLAIPGVESADNSVARFLGMPSTREAINAHAQALADANAAGIEPGGMGKTAGEIIATAPTMFIPGGPLVQGAASGALLTDGSSIGDIAGDATLGALGGKLADGLVNGVARAVSPMVRPAVQKLIDAGVPLTPGQIMGGIPKAIEDKASSIPVVGDMINASRARGVDAFNRATVNRALDPIGLKLPEDVATGHDAIAFAQDALSDTYNRLLPALTMRADRRLASGVQRAVSGASSLPAERQTQLQSIIQSKLVDAFDNTGAISGEGMKRADSELGRLARSYRGSVDPDQRDMGAILGNVQGELRSMVKRQNPQAAKIIDGVNSGYAALVRAENAATRAGNKGGVFTPPMLNSAVRQMDTSLRKRSVARGAAMLQDLASAGNEVLPSSVPDSGTAGRFLLGAGGLGGVLGATTHDVTPAVLGVLGTGAAAAPYTKVGQKAATGILTSRPAGAKSLADLIRLLGPPATTAGAVTAIEGAR